MSVSEVHIGLLERKEVQPIWVDLCPVHICYTVFNLQLKKCKKWKLKVPIHFNKHLLDARPSSDVFLDTAFIITTCFSPANSAIKFWYQRKLCATTEASGLGSLLKMYEYAWFVTHCLYKICQNKNTRLKEVASLEGQPWLRGMVIRDLFWSIGSWWICHPSALLHYKWSLECTFCMLKHLQATQLKKTH